MRIAILDDKPIQLEWTRQSLEAIGHECHCFADGRSLLRDLKLQSYDLLVLDWSLSDVQGPTVVKWIRSDLNSQLPIMIATTRSEKPHMVEALESGADDFLVRPAAVGEFEARVTALLRRAYPAQSVVELEFGAYHFHPRSRMLRIRGKAVDLKHREYELAHFLFRNIGRLLSREHLREAVWGPCTDSPSRSLDTHVSRLRSKLDLRPANGFMLAAVYGLGYRLESLDSSSLAA
ncbi:response regulator transcription factor [soil metagenome]